jgi:hypothetical protein
MVAHQRVIPSTFSTKGSSLKNLGATGLEPSWHASVAAVIPDGLRHPAGVLHASVRPPEHPRSIITEARTAARSGPDDCPVRHSRASDTAAVREAIDDGETGRLAGFFEAEGFASRALEVQRDPKAHCVVGDRPAAVIEERYSRASPCRGWSPCSNVRRPADDRRVFSWIESPRIG